MEVTQNEEAVRGPLLTPNALLTKEDCLVESVCDESCPIDLKIVHQDTGGMKSIPDCAASPKGGSNHPGRTFSSSNAASG